MSVIFRVIGWDAQQDIPAPGSLGAIEAAPVIIGYCLPRVGDILETPQEEEFEVVKVFHQLFHVGSRGMVDPNKEIEFMAEKYGITQWLGAPPSNWDDFLKAEILVAAVPVKRKS